MAEASSQDPAPAPPALASVRDEEDSTDVPSPTMCRDEGDSGPASLSPNPCGTPPTTPQKVKRQCTVAVDWDFDDEFNFTESLLIAVA